jgi:hypothetical protein
VIDQEHKIYIINPFIRIDERRWRV